VRVDFLSPGLRDLSRRFPAVASLPDERRRFIQAISPVTVEIVNQSLIGQFVNYKFIFSGARFSLAIGFHITLV
jgi:hypothetical protein